MLPASCVNVMLPASSVARAVRAHALPRSPPQERVCRCAALGDGSEPEGVASLEVALETLKLAEVLTGLLQKQLLDGSFDGSGDDDKDNGDNDDDEDDDDDDDEEEEEGEDEEEDEDEEEEEEEEEEEAEEE